MRLIDADALRTSIRESIEECRKWADEIHDGEMYARVSQSIGTFVECSLRIKNAPTVDAIERKRGKWEWHSDDELYYSCSCCGHKAYGNTLEIIDGAYHFCPNCGAKMDEVNE